MKNRSEIRWKVVKIINKYVRVKYLIRISQDFSTLILSTNFTEITDD